MLCGRRPAGSVRVRRVEPYCLTGWCDADFSWLIALSGVFGLHPEHRVERFYLSIGSAGSILSVGSAAPSCGRLSRLPGLRVLDRLSRQPRFGFSAFSRLSIRGWRSTAHIGGAGPVRLSVPQGKASGDPADGGSGADGIPVGSMLVIRRWFLLSQRRALPEARGYLGPRRSSAVQRPGRWGGGITAAGGKGQAVDN